MIAERWARGTADSPGDITRRELYFFNLYRCLEAIVYAGLVFSPVIRLDLVHLTHPGLGQSVALAYLVAAMTMLVATDRMRAELATSISVGLVIDILAASLILVALSGHNAVPIMLLVNVGVAALLLPHRAFFFATLAAIGVIAQAFYAIYVDSVVGSGMLRSRFARVRELRGRCAVLLSRRPHARDRSAGGAARRRSSQSRTGQRPDHPAHEDRRAAGRSGQPHPAHQRSGLASDRQSVAESARARHDRAGTVASPLSLAAFGQDRSDRGRARRRRARGDTAFHAPRAERRYATC